MNQLENIFPDKYLVRESEATIPLVTTKGGSPQDPDEMTVTVEVGDVEREFYWNVTGRTNSPEITRSGAGQFSLSIICHDAGHYRVRRVAPGADERAVEGYFYVYSVSPHYPGIISDDDLLVAAGRPSQHQDDDTFFPLYGPGSLTSFKTRRIEQFVSEIERHVHDMRESIKLDHLTQRHTIALVKNHTTQGLAGATLPADYIRYIFQARHPDGTLLEYDNDIHMYVGEYIPGVTRYRCRLSGADIEALPNENFGGIFHLLHRDDAVRGIMPHVIGDLNKDIINSVKDAIKSNAALRQSTRQQNVEAKARP